MFSQLNPIKIFPKLFWKYLNNQINVQNLFDANEKKMFDKYKKMKL